MRFQMRDGYVPVLLVASLLVIYSTTKCFCRKPNQRVATTPMRVYGDYSFPGMNDNTTHPGCSAAHVIVDLHRHYRDYLPITPFTPLLLNHSNCSCGSIESNCCRPDDCCSPNSLVDSLTIPEWVEYCDEDYLPMTDFVLYYDFCSAVFTWLRQSCSTLARNRVLVRVGTISLVDNEMTGWVMNGSQVLIPDVFDTCWILDCSFLDKRTTDECIQFAQENIVRYTIEDFVNIVKFVLDE